LYLSQDIDYPDKIFPDFPHSPNTVFSSISSVFSQLVFFQTFIISLFFSHCHMTLYSLNNDSVIEHPNKNRDTIWLVFYLLWGHAVVVVKALY
jgi:hypothetical protein